MNSFIQSICGAASSIALGLSAIARKKATQRVVLFKMLVILAFIAATDAPFSEQDMYASPSYSKANVSLQVDAPVISLSEAKRLVDDKGAAIYQVSTSSTHEVTGLNSYHPSEYESLKASLVLNYSHADIKNIILVSHDRNAAYDMANNLSGLLKNVFILDSSDKVVEQQLDVFFNTNVPTSLSIPVSESDIRLTGNSLYSELNAYSVIKLTNSNLLDSGLYAHGMTFDMFSLMLSDMKALASDKRLESHRNVMFLFPNGFSKDNMKRVSEYLLANIESAGITIGTKAAEYMTTEMLDSVFSSSLRIEDFISNPTPANRSELTATEIKAALGKHDNISLVCVAKNCSHTALGIHGLHPVEVRLSVGDGSLFEDTTQLEANKDKPVIFVADDLGSLNLAKLVSNNADYYGFHVLGITTLDTLTSLVNDTANINTVGYAVELMANFMAPDSPFKTSTFILLLVGAATALLIKTPYKTLKAVGAFAFVYIVYYHHLWIKASPIEYGYSLTKLVTLFMLGTYIFALRKEKKTFASTLPVALASMSICGLFVYIMMPPADKLIFGFVFGLNFSLLIKNQIEMLAKTGSNIRGENYELTSPLISGFRGYVVGKDKSFSKLTLLPSKKWKIFHNHTSIYGSEAGGFNGCIVADRASVNKHISTMSAACVNAGMNEADIQFWVTPTMSEPLYRGKVYSHSQDEVLCWTYTLTKKGKDGEMTSIGRDICRAEQPKGWIEWQLHYNLKRAEMAHGVAVGMIIHVSKWLKRVKVVLVEVQSSQKTESVALSTWRKEGSKAKSRTATAYGSNTLSALNVICNGAVIYGDKFSYVLAQQEDKFDIQVAHRCMTQLSNLASQKGLTKEHALTEMTKYFEPVLRMKASNRMTLKGSYQDVLMGAITFCNKYAPTEVVFADGEESKAIMPPPTEQLIVKYLTRMAVTLFKLAK